MKCIKDKAIKFYSRFVFFGTFKLVKFYSRFVFFGTFQVVIVA